MSTTPLHPDEIQGVVAEACLCCAIQSAGRAVGRRFDAAFRDVGLTNWQFSLLLSLVRDEPPTIGALAAGVFADRTTVSANLKPLLRRGLVAVLKDEADRRARRIMLTEAGRSVLDEAVHRWRAVNDAVASRLGAVDAQALRAALRALSKA